MVSATVKSGICMGCGSFGVVLGAIMVVLWPGIFMGQLHKMLTLTPTSMSFGIWQETPIPMYLECFLFNITNVEEILSRNNVSIRVEQLGPYVYKETHTKTNLTWHDNSTIQFYNQRFWHFEPDMSNGSLSDVVTNINPVIATVAYIRRHSSTLVNMPVDAFLRFYHSNMFTSANVSDWLFEGIDDPVLDIALQFPNIPLNIPFDKFGWFYDRNGSTEYDGAFLMNTGLADFSQIGNIEKWRYSDRTIYRDECGVVKGSTGELWAPELGQPDVTIFAPDVCTYLILNKERDVTVEGLEGVQYAANDSVFDNGYNYPRTECYCDKVRDRDCLPPGALNVSDCRYGAPAFVSLPHFLHSDPYYPSKIEGLEPTDDMDFRLALEMFTGMPLAVSAQLQINFLVRHVSGITINNLLPDPDVLVPMFWFRQEVRITREYAGMAQRALRVRYWMSYAFYGITVIGVILLSIGVSILIRKLLKSPETPILKESSQDRLSD